MVFTSKIKGIFASIIVLISSFFFFESFLYKGLYPGESAHDVAVALGVESGTTIVHERNIVTTKDIAGPIYRTREPERTHSYVNLDEREFNTKHLIWRILTTSIVKFFDKDAVGALNMLAVILGSLSVMLTFALGRGLIIFLNFHDSPIASADRKRSAFAAGLVAAMALAFSTPFWLSATRVMSSAFDLFLIVFMGWVLFCAAVHRKTWYLGLFGLIWGVALFEMQSTLFISLVLIVFAVRSMYVAGNMNIRGWCNLLFGSSAGIVIYLILSSMLLQSTQGSLILPFRELFSQVSAAGALFFGGGIFGYQARMITLFVVIIPFIVTVCHAIWHTTERRIAAGDFLIFLMVITTFIALTSTALSPWRLFREHDPDTMPIWLVILAAAVAAYVAAVGALRARGSLLPFMRRVDDDDEEGTIEVPVGRLLFWAIFFLSVFTAPINYSEIKSSKDSFISRMGELFVDKIGVQGWISSTTPVFDTIIRINAFQKDKSLSVIDRKMSQSATLRMKHTIESHEDFKDLPTEELVSALVSTNVNEFIITWIKCDDRIGDKLLLDSPHLWELAGKEAVPALVGYRAKRDGEVIDWQKLAEEHFVFWREVKKLDYPLPENAPEMLRKTGNEVRSYLSDIGHNLAECDEVKTNTTLVVKIKEALILFNEEPKVTTKNKPVRFY